MSDRMTIAVVIQPSTLNALERLAVKSSEVAELTEACKLNGWDIRGLTAGLILDRLLALDDQERQL